ncbi:kinase-like domain-containing protein [Mycena polygramma]|nr:kinase-like domain-containing protein [Mycena polygramma]
MPTNQHGVTANLIPFEVFWRDHCDHILQHGYELRPRYRPDWVPSWKPWCDAEDSPWLADARGVVNDARRCTDNVRVALKRVGLQELATLQHLHSLPPSSQNRTVPLLDVIPLEDPKQVVIVMPLLRCFHRPPFERLDEVIHALLEIMKGIAFMHSHNIAHRDACLTNFVMDSTELIPSGFHFGAPDFTPDFKHFIKPRHRFAVNVSYYIIDFNTALINPGPGQAMYPVGQDRTVPEYESENPYDPFKLDIYQVGNIIRRAILAVYADVDVLAPIAEAMTRRTPSERPTADQVVQSLKSLANEYTDGPWIYLRGAGYWAKKKVQWRNKRRGSTVFWCWGPSRREVKRN